MKTLKSSLAATVLILATTPAFAGSFFKPKEPVQTPQPAPVPTPAPVQPPAPAPTPSPVPPPKPSPVPPPPVQTPEQPPVQSFDLFYDVGDIVAESVDNYYNSGDQLQDRRSSNGEHSTDVCQGNFNGQDQFSDRMAYFVDAHLSEEFRPRVESIASVFGASSTLSSHHPLSLKSQPMCNVNRSDLAHSLGSEAKVPAQSVINKLNQFTDKYNSLRTGALQGKVESRRELTKLWTRFMGCLSYTESLTTADTSSSNNVANKYAPSGYRKPAGVKFYEDPGQPPVSRLNIGLFQFTPDSGGNIHTCIRQWNDWHPGCGISRSASQDELIRVLGSSYQAFNTFCGVNKITQSFAIQVNAMDSRSTHPANRSGSGFKPSSQRCVTPFFRRSYNHFGPLQNSTGDNLNKLMTCVLAN